ncbi:aminotransferase class IV [Flagellimonas eckloniae]|uniref:Aminotransferase IV n=1 Tax=Flagellimonas eckloniae TaxID=346185 RepID=A0A0N8WFW2_9FLAO|nr:aminotransferase class IV [Allomuricauda eckloniae]KQC29811.1 aminotransferase IV [Allomuricauda eckloniae]
MNNYPENVYINGKIVPHEEAKISIFDRGFLFGDGVYEVMVQIGKNFFYGEEHLDRLAGCLKKIGLDFNVSTLFKEIENLLLATKLDDKSCMVYIQITRGVAIRSHAFPKAPQPTIVMYAVPFTLPDINQKSIATVTTVDNRWHRCDIKTTSLLGNVMANNLAAEQGMYESIFIRNGNVTEASHSNVFFVKDKIVYTHPANAYILNGITRQLVIQLCKKLEIEVKEDAIPAENISKMDEAFLTGTATQIASIGSIDSHFYTSDGTIGPITQRLQNAFLELKQNLNRKSITI